MVELELLLRLVSVRERRSAGAARIAELAERADWSAFKTLAARHKLLALASARLEETLDAPLPPELAEPLAATRSSGARQTTLLEGALQTLTGTLAAAGVPSVTVKGPAWARLVMHEPELRPSLDVDLVVRPADFDAAIAALEPHGYEAAPRERWFGTLPLFETSLHAGGGWLPLVDLHWRVHWYERSFADDLVANAVPGAGGVPTLDPAAHLAVILLTYARDGFDGLKLAADAACWWDRFGTELPNALDPSATRHPALRRPLEAALLVVERLTGLPAQRVLASAATPARAVDRAVRLAAWSGAGDRARRAAAAGLIDVLLAPPAGRREAIARQLLRPPAVIETIYGLPPDARVRRALRGAWYAGATAAAFAPAWAAGIAATRGGRSLDALPPPLER